MPLPTPLLSLIDQNNMQRMKRCQAFKFELMPRGRRSTAAASAHAAYHVSAAILISAAMLNRLTLILSPIALASVLSYSYTKRFTSLSHLALGWSLSIAPTGAWIAVRGHLDSPVPLLLSLSVMLWTAGFDVIYACQDVEFDRNAGLHSIPEKLGIAGGLWVARLLHAMMFAALIAFFYYARLGWLGLVGVIATGALLVYQHSIVKKDDLSRVNAAFFTTNAFVSLILFLTGFGDLLIR